jgi:hypothetical protein
VFSPQVVVGLDEYGIDYTGGEFLLVEQRPRPRLPRRLGVNPQLKMGGRPLPPDVLHP